jgi:DinB superfamily
MSLDAALRQQLVKLLAWGDAHATHEKAVKNVSEEYRSRVPQGLPYSPWMVVDHLTRTQFDILDFCRNPNYTQPRWPEQYWPPTAQPPSATAWDESISKFRTDRAELQQLAADPSVDLTAKIPWGDGQTYLREIVLAADHAAYHVGELIVIRRLLGIWP